MATRIRLKRGGRKAKAYYRIVVQDGRARRGGPELDIIGYYHPAARPEPVSEVDVHRALDWLKKGAEMSDTARSVLSKLGVLKHHHDGTMPESATASLKGGVVENKGYNAPPPQEEAPAASAAEEPEQSPTEAVAEASEPESNAAESESAPENADAAPAEADASADTEES